MKQDMKQIAVAVRAIDVGYFNVKYTTGRKLIEGNNTIDVGLFPALAPLAAQDNGGEDSGQTSEVCLVIVGDNTYAVGPKSFLHADVREPRTIDPNYCESDKYKALMLGAMYYMAEAHGPGHEFVIETLVVGLPLITYQQFALSLESWVPGEHLIHGPGAPAVQRRVTVNQVLVKVQPYGGLVHFGVSRKAKLDGWSLVIDTGGGTLDWCMSRSTDVNWKRSGAYPRAMLECAYAVADAFNRDWRNRFDIVEVIDAALRTNAATFKVGTREYSLAKHRAKVDAVLEEAVTFMLSSTGSLDNVNRVLLTGGGATVLGEYLARTRPELVPALEMDDDPVFSNVRGFQVLGEVAQLSKLRS